MDNCPFVTNCGKLGRSEDLARANGQLSFLAHVQFGVCRFSVFPGFVGATRSWALGPFFGRKCPGSPLQDRAKKVKGRTAPIHRRFLWVRQIHSFLARFSDANTRVLSCTQDRAKKIKGRIAPVHRRFLFLWVRQSHSFLASFSGANTRALPLQDRAKKTQRPHRRNSPPFSLGSSEPLDPGPFF